MYANAGPMATCEAQRKLGEPPAMRGQFSDSLLYLPYLLLYWQQERPSPFLVRAADLRKHWSG